jgi:hypothetical protein
MREPLPEGGGFLHFGTLIHIVNLFAAMPPNQWKPANG